MGLDIYLYKYDNFEKTKKLEGKYEKESEKNWEFSGKEYKELTEAEKESAREKNKELAKELGLGEYGEDVQNTTKTEIASSKYPEHYCKIGYLRSSYNEGGANRIFSNLLGKDLYYIFDYDPEKQEYEFQPDWNKSRERAKLLLKEFEDATKPGFFGTSCFSWNEFQHPKDCQVDSECKAYEVFQRVFNAHKDNKDSFGAFGNSKGEFHLKEPLKVVGIISGVKGRFLVDEKLPCQYIVYKHSDESYDYYHQLLEIVIEFIDYVLAQKEIEKYYMHWSG